MTSGLPDDSRESDDCAEAKRLADLRGRVKRARTVISTTKGLAETLAMDPSRAVVFYLRWGVTASQLTFGVSSEPTEPT